MPIPIPIVDLPTYTCLHRFGGTVGKGVVELKKHVLALLIN